MTLEQRQEWGEWYAGELGFDEETRESLLGLLAKSSQTIMPDCEYCNRRLKRLITSKAKIPVYRRCECFDANKEWQERLDRRDRERDAENKRQWEEKRLKHAEESGECPSSSVGADWHGVKRGKDGQKAVDAVQKWTGALCGGEKVSSLYLHGPRGTGKTTLAGLVIQQAIVGGISARYVRWSGLLYDIKAGWSDKKVSDPMVGLRTVKLLVIDDWGKDMGSSWVSQTAFYLIDAREQRGLATMYTSNHPIKVAAQRLGDDKASAIEDRLSGNCEVVALGGKSHRG